MTSCCVRTSGSTAVPTAACRLGSCIYTAGGRSLLTTTAFATHRLRKVRGKPTGLACLHSTFTFKRCYQSRASQPGGSRVGRPTTADPSTGCSTDDFDDDDDDCALDSFISDSFDESVWAAAADNHHHHHHPGASLAKNACTSEVSKATSTTDSTRAKPESERRAQLRHGASAYRGEDSLATLTNLELIARQWRTSAMLRVWRFLNISCT
ncbi:uncharacterized protein LOC125942594 [Dermacentor silvarum]|uniref:uncharacterized protein LOC125942594 n=1 Tax=Dermacentor silvarum TaxID=543639 RepID=UPI0021013121|nr:uncharacterized protein LOC125942594 [Dermacentor silvarum]